MVPRVDSDHGAQSARNVLQNGKNSLSDEKNCSLPWDFAFDPRFRMDFAHDGPRWELDPQTPLTHVSSVFPKYLH